jgi:hypothetical protein
VPAWQEDLMNIDLGEAGAFYERLMGQAEARGLEKGIEKGIEKGREEGRLESARELFTSLAAARGWTLTAPQMALLNSSRDPERLRRWCSHLISCSSADEALSG